jgi:hypothetical protein
MNSQTVWQRTLGFVGSKPVIIETSNAQLTSDAGLLPMRDFDESLGFTRGSAAALDDTRDARYGGERLNEIGSPLPRIGRFRIENPLARLDEARRRKVQVGCDPGIA